MAVLEWEGRGSCARHGVLLVLPRGLEDERYSRNVLHHDIGLLGGGHLCCVFYFL